MPFHARSLAARLILVSSALLGAYLGGCSSDDASSTPTCAGVERGGVCYAKCDEKVDCQSGQRCVAPDGYPEGGCFKSCAAVTDCGAGTACVDQSTMSGEAGKFCLPRSLTKDASGKVLPDGKPGDACTTAADCDIDHGVRCAGGKCTLAYGKATEPCGAAAPCDAGLACLQGQCAQGCNSLTECPDGTECHAVTGQSTAGACAPAHPDAGPGQYGQACPNGPSDCNADAGFVCSNPKDKNGDASAYCTKSNGCMADKDCPSGYWCGAVTSVDAKTKNVDYDNPVRVCQKRVFCAPCESNLDCSSQIGAVCVPDANGEKFCSISCDPNTNSCIIGASCVDSGGGAFACRPDVGYCHSKEPKGCDPCRIDSDCGAGSLCREGKFGYKPTVRWCSTPCGGPDEAGKGTCPVASNGLEMVCLDENEISFGGPFSSSDPNSVYKHCYAPLTVDNSAVANGQDPQNGACGNARREGAEECDDANASNTDGCGDDCKVSDACRFTVEEPNGDGNLQIMKGGAPLDAVPSTCKTFYLEGSIDSAGDVDSFKFSLPNNQSAWVDVFTDNVNTCNADLVAEVRAGQIDLAVPCTGLSQDIKDLADQKLCSDGNLGCGSCDKPGVCGVCDDDAGLGDCPRMLISTSTSYGQYKIKFDAAEKTVRIYAKDKSATVGKYIVVVSRLPYDTAQQSPKYAPGTSCW